MEELIEFCEKMAKIASDSADEAEKKEDGHGMSYNSGAEFAYCSVIREIKRRLKNEDQ